MLILNYKGEFVTDSRVNILETASRKTNTYETTLEEFVK